MFFSKCRLYQFSKVGQNIGRLSAEYRPIRPADHRPTVGGVNVIRGFTVVFFFMFSLKRITQLAIYCNFKGYKNGDLYIKQW